MAIYFMFALDEVAARVLYLDLLQDTVDMQQVTVRIQEFRNGVRFRIPKAFPH